MKRKLYNFCTLASLLLLCGTLLWWSHSSRNTDQVTLRGVGGAAVQVTGSGGQVMVTSSSNVDGKSGGELRWSTSSDSGEPKLLATSFQFNTNKGLTMILPLWALAFGFALAPGMWVYGKMKRKGGKKKPEGGH
jgi:hypothetical protein